MAPSGSTCAVVGCTNNTRKLKDFMHGTCFQHKQTRLICCPAPYSLHAMPKNETKTREWLAALKLKNPPKRVYVCSYHFIDHKPTELHPNPELFLGYKRPVKNRRKLIRCSDNLEVQANANQTLAWTSNSEVKHVQDPHCGGNASSDATIQPETSECSVQARREAPGLLDHGYAKGLMVLVLLPAQPAYKMGDLHSDRRAASLHLGQNEPSEPEWTTRQAASTPPEVYESADERPMMKSEDFAGNMEPSEPEWTTRQAAFTPPEVYESADERPMMKSGNMDLGHPFSPVCNVTETQQDCQLSVFVKEEVIEEEEHDHVTSCSDEEKPFADPQFGAETESNASDNETQQTAAEIEVKIEEDDEPELDHPLRRLKGRPSCDISRDILEAHLTDGVKPPEIARLFGLSTSTIRRRMEQYGLRMTDLYTDIQDNQLDQIVLEYHRMNPNAGYKTMYTYLKSQGIRVPCNRVRQSVRRVDAEGTKARRMSIQACIRKQYSVPGPNSL
ncbi:uncharacterized protein LOC134093057 isoform X2 [Sardina pilchardus]|uniref:uncharacterized protein LOC134093057 isoform X2 n=1 Tax=Sardina pilchardus TaxID=27697 RepID=UPI002E0D708F